MKNVVRIFVFVVACCFNGCMTRTTELTSIRLRLLPLENVGSRRTDLLVFRSGRSLVEEISYCGDSVKLNAVRSPLCALVIENLTQQQISIPNLNSDKWRMVVTENGLVEYNCQLFPSRYISTFGEKIPIVLQPGEATVFVFGSEEYQLVRNESSLENVSRMTVILLGKDRQELSSNGIKVRKGIGALPD